MSVGAPISPMMGDTTCWEPQPPEKRDHCEESERADEDKRDAYSILVRVQINFEPVFFTFIKDANGVVHEIIIIVSTSYVNGGIFVRHRASTHGPSCSSASQMIGYRSMLNPHALRRLKCASAEPSMHRRNLRINERFMTSSLDMLNLAFGRVRTVSESFTRKHPRGCFAWYVRITPLRTTWP